MRAAIARSLPNPCDRPVRQAFLQHSFHLEAALHRDEAVTWPQLELPDNSSCIAALMNAPHGILVLLDGASTEAAFFETVSREV